MASPVSRNTHFVVLDDNKEEVVVAVPQVLRALEPTPEELKSLPFQLACGRIKKFFQFCSNQGEFGNFAFVDLKKTVADFLIDFVNEIDFKNKTIFEERIRGGELPSKVFSDLLGLSEPIEIDLLKWRCKTRSGPEEFDGIQILKEISQLFSGIDLIKNYSLEVVFLEGLKNDRKIFQEIITKLKKLGLWTVDHRHKTIHEAIETTLFSMVFKIHQEELAKGASRSKFVFSLYLQKFFVNERNQYSSIQGAFKRFKVNPFSEEEIALLLEIDKILISLRKGIHIRLSLEQLAHVSNCPLEVSQPKPPIDQATLISYYQLFLSTLYSTSDQLEKFADAIFKQMNGTVEKILSLLTEEQKRKHKNRIKLAFAEHLHKPFKEIHDSFFLLSDIISKRGLSATRSIGALNKNEALLQPVAFEIQTYLQNALTQFRDLYSKLLEKEEDIIKGLGEGKFVKKAVKTSNNATYVSLVFEPTKFPEGSQERTFVKESLSHYIEGTLTLSNIIFVLNHILTKIPENPQRNFVAESIECNDDWFETEPLPPSPLVKNKPKVAEEPDEKQDEIQDLGGLVPPAKAAQQLPVQKNHLEELAHLQKQLESESPVLIDAIGPYILGLNASLSDGERKTREVCSHIFLATQGFELFVDAVSHGRWELLELFYQNLMVDALAAVEQRLKLEVIATTGETTDSHGLLDLARASKITLSSEEKKFLKEHDKSFIRLRYPEYYARHLKTLAQLRDKPSSELFLEIAHDYLTALKLIHKVDDSFLVSFQRIEVILKEAKPSVTEKIKSSEFTQIIGPLDKNLKKCLTVPSIEGVDPVLPIREIRHYLDWMHLAEHAHSIYQQPSLTFWFMRMKLHQDKLFKQLFTARALLEGLGWIQSHNLKHYTEVLNLSSLEPNALAAIQTINAGIGNHYLDTVNFPLRREYLAIRESSQLQATRAMHPDFELVGEKEAAAEAQKSTQHVLKLFDETLATFRLLLPDTMEKLKNRNRLH